MQFSSQSGKSPELEAALELCTNITHTHTHARTHTHTHTSLTKNAGISSKPADKLPFKFVLHSLCHFQ
jgi:fructoselysine-6-P-deglycase FrlB-like protein